MVSLLSAALGEVLPEPTDPLYFFIGDWIKNYGSLLEPWFLRFSELWTYYFLSATWYLFLLAVLLQFCRETSKAILYLLTAGTIGYVFLYWWQGASTVPIAMTFENGMNLIYGSVVAFGILVIFDVWKLRQLYGEIEIQ